MRDALQTTFKSFRKEDIDKKTLSKIIHIVRNHYRFLENTWSLFLETISLKSGSLSGSYGTLYRGYIFDQKRRQFFLEKRL